MPGMFVARAGGGFLFALRNRILVRIEATNLSVFSADSYKNAQTYAGLAEDKTKFVLLRLAPGTDRATVKRAVAARMPGVDVFTAAEFSLATQGYWLFTTGAGMALVIAGARAAQRRDSA